MALCFLSRVPRDRRSRSSNNLYSYAKNGGGGIRTPETGVARLTVFKTVAFNQLCHPSRDALRLTTAEGCFERSARRLARGPTEGGALARAVRQPLNSAVPNPGEVAERLKALAC